MTTAAERLAALHQLLLELRDTKDQLARGPRQIAARKQLVENAEAELAGVQAELKSLRAAAERKSLDLKTNEAKIEDLKAKLNMAASNREYDIIRGQIDADTMANSVLEDEVLEIMEKTDHIQGTIGEYEAKVKTAQEELKRFSDAFAAEETELRAKATDLAARIEQTDTGLEGQDATKYRRLVELHGADAMATVENGNCSNCYVQVTPQVRVLLNNGKVLFCGSCSRLLYLVKQPEST
jgi:predicted  nucleic acid-binding Zn-ribbon protein